MKKFVFGEFVLSADVKSTREHSSASGPYFAKCCCIGCQNFFKSAAPYKNELEAALSPLGLDWKKPLGIEVLYAKDKKLLYKVVYIIQGKRIAAPKIYETAENEIGRIKIFRPESCWQINEKMSAVFHRGGKDKIVLELRAELPWVMETVGCVYDPSEKIVLPRTWRIKRIIKGVKKILNQRTVPEN